MIRVAICEEDLFYRDREKKLMESYLSGKEIRYELKTFHSSTELIKKYKNEYDIVFLDIGEEQMEGLEAARWLREKSEAVFIVFWGAYAEYSLEGYKVDAHRYLLKDDENIEDTFEECMDSILEKMQKNEGKVDLDVLGGVLSIAPSKILFAESNVHKVIIHVIENSGDMREYYMYDKLDHVQELLEQYGFMRIHQSYLINKEYLKTVCRYKAELSHDVVLGISKKYYKEIEEYYIRMRGEL